MTAPFEITFTPISNNNGTVNLHNELVSKNTWRWSDGKHNKSKIGDYFAFLDWYQREFGRAIQSAEYQAWAGDSFIFTDPQQLSPQGTARYAEQLRRSFAPIIQRLQ